MAPSWYQHPTKQVPVKRMIGATLSAEISIIVAPTPHDSQTSHHTILLNTKVKAASDGWQYFSHAQRKAFQTALTKTRKTLRILAFNSRGYSSLATDHHTPSIERTHIMGNAYRGRNKLRRLQKPAVDKPIDELLKGLRPKPSASSNSSYREQSLKLHGLICAKCAREFDFKTRHLLTVHHKDGNHHNNPPDGSNWENLCVYCHDDEHSRGILGDYLRKAKEDKP